MKKILILTGDPNSINSEIIIKSWRKIKSSIKQKIIFISNFRLLSSQLKVLGYAEKLEKIKNINDNNKSSKIKILDIDIKFKDPFNINKEETSKFIKKSLNLAHILALGPAVKGLINCAIDKKLLDKKNIGVTEYLAFKCNIKKDSVVMLLKGDKFSVSPITTHIPIKLISKKISVKTIENKIKLINNWFKKHYKKTPKIAVLGLNPHNGELLKDSEEKKIIIPAIKKLTKKKITIVGPIPADSIFSKSYKNFDIIVGMYHDQVLAPFKALNKFDGINITLGLKYLRVSPDHGTAKNLIKKDKANIESFLSCINFLEKFK